jgi:hypothetical protein
MNLLKPTKGEPECLHRAFKALEQVHRHEGAQAQLTILLPELSPAAADLCVVDLLVFRQTAWQDVADRRVDPKFHRGELEKDIVEAHHIGAFRELAVEGERLAARGKFANLLGVVERRDVAARASDGDRIEQLEKVKIQRARIAWGVRSSGGSFDQALKAACARRKIWSMLRSALELRFEGIGFAFVRQRQLILEVVEAVVDRSGGEHQHLGANTLLDDPIHEPSGNGSRGP